MDSSEIPRIAYLVLLLVAVGGWFIAENRTSLGKTLRMALAWGLIFLGAVAAVGMWGDIRGDLVPRQSLVSDAGRVEVPRAFDGHYYLTLRVNDQPVRFVVDTGATDIVLTKDDAARVGINEHDLIFSGRAMTANGEVRTALAMVPEIALGPIVDRDVRVTVNQGEMPGSLLGMSYLQRFDSLAISDGLLVLQR